MDSDQRRGIQAAVVAYAGWGLLTLYWRQLHEFDPVDLVGWRIGSATVVMMAVVLATGRLRQLAPLRSDRRTLGNVVAAALLLTVNWSTYVWAVVNDHVIDTALGYFLAPLATMGFGIITLGERITPLKRWSMVSAGAAIAVLVGSYGRVPWVALLLAGSWTTYGIVKRRVRLDPIASLTGELLVVTVPAVLIVALSFGRHDGIPAEASGADWALVLGTGVITAVPLLLFAFAAKRVPFTVLGPINYLIPIINFLLGWLAFGEPLPPSRVVGFVLIWLALALVTVDALRDGRPANIRRSPDPDLEGSRRT